MHNAMRQGWSAWLCIVALCVGTLPSRATAQRPSGLDAGGDLEIGGEAERYLRALQLVGGARATSWTIRSTYALHDSARMLDLDHPWKPRFATSRSTAFGLRMLRPGARLIYNSTFPAGTNDGPTWAGRGLTGELRAGIGAELGPLHVQLQPILFLAQNQVFTLAPNGEAGRGQYRDARFPQRIDIPQRFGSGAYGRADWGNSTVALELPGTVIGVSTAAQSWGPAREYPLVLGPSSGGFPHAFVGTRDPLSLWLFSVHTRLIAGKIAQSPYSPIDTGSGNRWASGVVVAITPRGVPGLEVGLTRFVQAKLIGRLPTAAQVRRAISGVQVSNADNIESENQIASAFFRWGFPGAGFELYTEYAREDYSLDGRRFLQYPDDLRSYEFGVQRVMKSGGRMRSWKFELVNAELSSSNRGERGDVVDRKLREPFPPYLHGSAKQGHTNHGLFLGSPEAYGGAAWRLGVDQFDREGRTSFTLERSLRLDWLPPSSTNPETVGVAVHPDVIWGLGAETMRFVKEREYKLSVTSMLNLNRNLVRNHDVLNLRVALSVRGWR